MRIGLVSDTHVPTALKRLPRSLLEALKNAHVDRILHSGDLTVTSVIGSLERIAPTVAVAGNMDPPEVRSVVPRRVIVEVDGWKIGLQHGDQRHALQNQYIGKRYDQPEMELFYQAMAAQLPDAQIIVFGHFHVPVVRQWREILFVNPGAVAPSHGRSTFALLDLSRRGDPAHPFRGERLMDEHHPVSLGGAVPPGVQVEVVTLTSLEGC